MFRVTIKAHLTIDGCPDSGIGAVDFRRGHGIPEFPSNRIPLEVDVTSEPLCRQFSGLLDANADLRIAFNDHWENTPQSLAIGGQSNGYGRRLPAIDPETVSAAVASPSDENAIGNLITAIVERAAAVADRRRLAEEETARHLAEREARDKAERAERERLAADGLAKLQEWGERHGSDLLRARIADGFEFVRLAEAEYGDATMTTLGLEKLPDAPDGYGDGKDEDRTTPTMDEIQALRAVRQIIQHRKTPAVAEIRWVKYKPLDDPHGYDEDESEPIQRAEICIIVTTPTGAEREYWVLPQEVRTV